MMQRLLPSLDPPRVEGGSSMSTPDLPVTTTTNALVVRVVDGDTITVRLDQTGEEAHIRMLGINTPETVDPRRPVECFGKEASEKARQILSGTSVRIETDSSQGELDKYGRALAYVFPEDGANFAELMISEGYGHEYTYNLPYKYQSEFQAAERRAREEKKGLWADSVCADSAETSVSAVNNAPPPAGGGAYECSKNIYNCSDFTSQAEAQSVFDSCLPAEASAQAGGGSANDVHKLDSDGDGKVCESLP